MSFLQPLSSCTVHCELKNPDSKESHFLAIFSRVVYEIQSEKPTIFLQVFYQNTETEFSTNVRCYKYLSKKGKVTTVSSGDYSYYKVNFSISLCATQIESKHLSYPKQFWLCIIGRIFSEENSSISILGNQLLVSCTEAILTGCCATKGKKQYTS